MTVADHDLELIQQAALRAAGDMRSEHHVLQGGEALAREPRYVHLLGGEVIADPWIVLGIAEHHPQHADDRIIVEKQDARRHRCALRLFHSVQSKRKFVRSRRPGMGKLSAALTLAVSFAAAAIPVSAQ